MILMKKIIAFVLIFVLYPLPVHASYPQAYSDYQFQYNQYRTAYQNYQIAKSAFSTYKTLATQNDALEKMRRVLVTRTNVLTAYLTLIQEKMAMTEGLDKQNLTTFQGISQTEKTWLTGNLQKISAASNINDLNTAASEFSSRYPQISREAALAVGQILLAKTNFASSKIDDFFARTATNLDRLESLGEDGTIYRRGLASARSKADLYQDKKTAAQEAFLKIELLNGQKALQEGLQYLKESTNFLKEILNSLTYHD